jgi:4-hydroxymandelate oxidase
MSMPVTDTHELVTDYTDPELLETVAQRLLHPAVFDYFAGGAGDESALRANVAAWQRLRVRPRVLRPVPEVDMSVSVLGSTLRVPIAVAPMGFQRLAHPDGERATAAAAASLHAAMALSTYATVTIEDVAATAPDATRWFQCYVLRDRGHTAELLQRAAASGFRAVLLTADAAAPGDRRRDRRHGYVLPHSPDVAPANLVAGPLSAAFSTELDTELSLDDIAWVAEASGLPVAVKGVLHPSDARDCVAAGAAAVVVSNHGGRQLDAAVATAAALPDIVAAVGGRGDVLVDGGIRSGADVLRALALGARAVLVGRPVLWALAAGGQAGVAQLLAALAADLDRCMRLCGISRLADITPDLLGADWSEGVRVRDHVVGHRVTVEP